MRPLTRSLLPLALVAALAACSASETQDLGPPLPGKIAWDGSRAAEQDTALTVQEYHLNGVARAFDALTQPPALKETAWNDA